ncbi:MAG: hypothetical protein ACRCWJ_03030 [Casimicrobium sp.]
MPESIPIWTSNYLIEFEIVDGLLLAIIIGVRCSNASDWPRFDVRSTSGAQKHLIFPAPQKDAADAVAFTFIALLSMRGFPARWDWEDPTRIWDPETTAEADALKLNNFRVTRKRRANARELPLKINDLTQTALASEISTSIRQPLEFLQYANERYRAKRYIEAFQYYFFVIESIFAGGYSSPAKVTRALLASRLFRIKLRMAIRYPTLYLRNVEEKSKYCDFVSGLSLSSATDLLVRTRGSLHHHSLRSPSSWSLHGQEKYWAITTLAANTTQSIMFRYAQDYLWHDEVLRQYEKVRASLSGGDESII